LVIKTIVSVLSNFSFLYNLIVSLRNNY